MPLTVITLRKSTPSLRGDLSKWMQEIATGVYVGNFNSRIREHLWSRVIESVGKGEATLSYAARNEIGYAFETHNTQQKVIDYDGIPLVIYPKGNNQKSKSNDTKFGFSKAAKFRKQKQFSAKRISKKQIESSFVILDIETDGLDPRHNSIIEIGALKITENGVEEFQRLIKYKQKLPNKIKELTGITDELLQEEGKDLLSVLEDLKDFIGEKIIVGYNVNFDMRFINYTLVQLNKEPLTNQLIDLQQLVKREKMLLSNYKLETVVKSYEINSKVEHRALADAKLILDLSGKVNKFHEILEKK
ncbi:MAG: type I-E CRISPR-associated endoribonuclease Cas2 [Clostridiaceae bacterium]|nr:type I-E CRISPR-associated endoribonuclease Cas2 [Clostridiaceae bacterium]